MADTEKKIAEIREALEKATPGPWVADDENGIIWSTDAKVVFNFTADEEEGDVNLIANAPEWLRFLLSQLDREREESRKLREERDKLIEGLRWYADKTNYVQEVHHLRHGTLIGPAEAIYYDEGQRARNILREIGVTVE